MPCSANSECLYVSINQPRSSSKACASIRTTCGSSSLSNLKGIYPLSIATRGCNVAFRVFAELSELPPASPAGKRVLARWVARPVSGVEWKGIHSRTAVARVGHWRSVPTGRFNSLYYVGGSLKGPEDDASMQISRQRSPCTRAGARHPAAYVARDLVTDGGGSRTVSSGSVDNGP